MLSTYEAVLSFPHTVARFLTIIEKFETSKPRQQKQKVVDPLLFS
jgi:hypothetical protein